MQGAENQFLSRFVQEGAKIGPLMREFAVQGAPVKTEVAGDLIGGAGACGQKQRDQFLGPVAKTALLVIRARRDQPFYLGRHGWIRAQKGRVQKIGGKDDAVGGRQEFGPHAEQRKIGGDVARRAVAQQDRKRTPAFP